ncbi:MAG TPA: transcriptional regulator [Treponemataceae bacterium]|mgnify:CR=1 FL=1|jgi:DNA-binding MarR family transcriptional regulator|nr:transcriptional regulator [Treponemataceae bacterium]
MNKLVHEHARLRILTLLASESGPVPFTALRDRLGMTGGNLSVQIKTLEDAGYVATEKYFADKKPRTDVRVTAEGEAALIAHLEELENLLAGLKAAKGAER